MLLRAAGFALLPLLAAENCQLNLNQPQTREESCLASFTTWAALGLAPEQVPEDPERLLKARLAVGDAVELRATTLSGPGRCDDLVSAVAWRSSDAGVADVAPANAATAELAARAPGEAAVWADVTLQDGAVRRAELYATPAGRTARLRVYGVVVSR